MLAAALCLLLHDWRLADLRRGADHSTDVLQFADYGLLWPGLTGHLACYRQPLAAREAGVFGLRFSIRAGSIHHDEVIAWRTNQKWRATP
jgi:hypothetical protein